MKKRFKHICITVFIAALSAIITFQVTYLWMYDTVKYTRKNAGDTADSSQTGELTGLSDDILSNLAELDAIYQGDYVHDIDSESLMTSLMNGYLYGTGDKYANYFTAEEYDSFILDQSGGLVGIGVNVIYDNIQGALEIVSVMNNSPALEANLQTGDLIYIVNGEYISEIGYYKAMSAMRGKVGTKASFAVLRPNGSTFDHIDFEIERAYVTVQSVTGHLYERDQTIGIVKITDFDRGTPNQFCDTLKELLDSGAKRFIFDVRNNPGGELNSILSVLETILPDGPLIRIVDKSGNEETLYNSDSQEGFNSSLLKSYFPKGYIDADFTVLINENTASAAELFSSAIKDYRAGTLVGKTTYGKGTMQTIYKLRDGSAVTVSNRMYNPPLSDNYEGVGVVPDVEIEMAENLKNKSLYKISDEEDTQLQKAIETLNTLGN